MKIFATLTLMLKAAILPMLCRKMLRAYGIEKSSVNSGNAFACVLLNVAKPLFACRIIVKN